ncbi:MAG: hypothetical protein WD887_02420 [Candidatus Saccharimonadales bacterium]
MNPPVSASAGSSPALVHDVMPPQPVNPELGQIIPVASQQLPVAVIPSVPTAPIHYQPPVAAQPTKPTKTPSDTPVLAITAAIAAGALLSTAAFFALG